ncbi:hypothetical protein F5Y17DRAFT_419206 [Xylariaceae sp. FL0594]|nr:hypothetical protein F5Y17DRAFT_419206 [Xylariaceae sp. FL0594]
MGYDSPNPSSTANTTNPTNSTNRPQMPSLSATAARGMSRPPLTPKIASASRSSHNQPKTPSGPSLASAAASLPRRTPQQQQSLRPSSTVSVNSNSPNRSLYDDPALSFSSHLSSNITPRSGSRQSRVDSANSTPNGTPNPERTEPWDVKANFTFSSPLSQGDPSRRPIVTFSAGGPEMVNSGEPKFFHASDVKTTAARPISASKTGASKGSTFFYANGDNVTPKKRGSPATLSPPLSPGLTRGQDNAQSKFIFANGTPEVRPSAPRLRSRRSGSTISTASKAPTAASAPVARSTAASQRPTSPSKLPVHSQSTYKFSANGATPHGAPTARVQITPPPPIGPPQLTLRRPGTATSRSSGHSRTGSLVQGEDPSESLRPLASPMSGLYPPANLAPTNPAQLTLASILQAADEFGEAETGTPPDDQAALQSPTKSTFSSSDPMAELVANARRERKVQDLQIRNASLEAINRTLERQLRKQTAELRRFRRLSRSGHPSMASTAVSSRVTSGAFSEIDLESLALSDLSEEASDMGDLGDEAFSDTESARSDLSPSTLAVQDAKHRQRDEERLTLDLAKHQQILTDSQKINQSIKRCLDWTEELIKEGKKALDYRVSASDVKLGGRVLDPLDEEDENSRILSSKEATREWDEKLLEPIGPADAPPPESSIDCWDTEAQDRDSGIELAGEGR